MNNTHTAVGFFKRVATSLALVSLLAGSSVASAQLDPDANQAASTQAHGVVNINTAGVEEFDKLPGIGPAKAQAIVNLRQQRGGAFRRVEDVMQVRGIGRKTFRKLQPMLTLTGATTLE